MNETHFIASLMAGGLVILFAGLIWFGVQSERKRVQELKKLGARNGYQWADSGSLQTLGLHGNLPLFQKGWGQRAKYILTGRDGVRKLRIFEHQYTVRDYRDKKRSDTKVNIQTVICFTSAQDKWPQFRMTPENFLHKIGAVVGIQDIDFDNQPAFSGLYNLQGEHESEVRKCFTPEVLEFFGSRPGVTVEASEGTIVFYAFRRRMDAEQIEGFLQDARQALQLLSL